MQYSDALWVDRTVILIYDTSNIISSKETKNIQPYIDKYFKQIDNFYDKNKLKIKPEKSKIMVVCKASRRFKARNLVINIIKNIIEQVQKLKTLWMFIILGLSNHANMNYDISKVNNRLSLLKVILKFPERRTKLILINSIIVSVF